MAGHPLVEKFRTGEAPAHLKSAAARGALPLAPEDLLEILFLLRKEPDKQLQQDIVHTVEGLPAGPLLAVASSPETTPAMLDFLARATHRREEILEKVLLNAAVTDATLMLFAERGSAATLDLLVLNQVRLTRNIALMQAMARNAHAGADVKRRLKEIWDLHKDELAAKARSEPAQSPDAAVPTAAPPAQAAATAAAVEPAPVPAPVPAEGEDVDQTVLVPPEAGAPSPDVVAAIGDDAEIDLESLASVGSTELDERILEEMLADEASEEELRLAQRLLTMNIPDKVQLAMKGNREARMVLIRDASKQVQEAVIDSPKITENEVEKIANMRSVSDDVLRRIGNDREFTKNYGICHALVRNPKTPQPQAMQIMQRLQNRDLTLITKDKNIPDIIRRHALITLEKRQPKKTAAGKKK